MDKSLDNQLHTKVQNHLNSCEVCRIELAELQTVATLFPELPLVAETETAKQTFQETLQQEKKNINTYSIGIKSVRWYQQAWARVAAAVVILATGFLVGRLTPAAKDNQTELATLQKEVAEMKQLVLLQMFKKESASERLQAIQTTYQLEKPDKEILTTLIETLHYDKNINVRIAAAEAMAKFGNEPEIRTALITALRKQTDPSVQITLIELLVSLKEKQALPELQQLMNNKKELEIVRFKAAEGVQTLL